MQRVGLALASRPELVLEHRHATDFRLARHGPEGIESGQQTGELAAVLRRRMRRAFHARLP